MDGLIAMHYLPTSQQLANVLTKAIPSNKLKPLVVYPTPSLRGEGGNEHIAANVPDG